MSATCETYTRHCKLTKLKGNKIDSWDIWTLLYASHHAQDQLGEKDEEVKNLEIQNPRRIKLTEHHLNQKRKSQGLCTQDLCLQTKQLEVEKVQDLEKGLENELEKARTAAQFLAEAT